jgi:hypothetical protein
MYSEPPPWPPNIVFLAEILAFPKAKGELWLLPFPKGEAVPLSTAP